VDEDKRALLADPDFKRPYGASGQAYGWGTAGGTGRTDGSPSDPRLEWLAAEPTAFQAARPRRIGGRTTRSPSLSWRRGLGPGRPPGTRL